MKRIGLIDSLRGLVMVIMCLDHTRDFFHISSLSQDPTDLATTTPFLFFTRWLTHICAPTFVFLAGCSVYLSMQQQPDIASKASFLRKRGLVLIFLEFTVIAFGLWGDIHFSNWLFNVIATIGVGFILLSFLLKCSVKSLAILGFCIVVLHNLSVVIPFSEGSLLKTILTPFFNRTAFPLPGNRLFIMGYPPIPWFGIMLLGYAAGPIFGKEPVERRRVYLKLALVAMALFVVLRVANMYGDPTPWSSQKTSLYTILSFINVTKYPPSLLYVSLFLGILIFLFYLIENQDNTFTKITQVYGKASLFYFLVHWYILRLLMYFMLYMQGFKAIDFEFGFNLGRPKASNGLDLWAVYLVWILVVIIMYPLCRWFVKFKSENIAQKPWLRYI